MTPYQGKIIASCVVSLRFSQSGYTISVNANIGDKVTKGQVLAALDPKPVQTQLDIDLANFRRIRAEFDKLSRELPEAKNENEKGEKEIAQSKLDIAVKNVETTKYELDHLTLISPINGLILDDSNLINGIYVTPGSYPITIADTGSFCFSAEVPETVLPSLDINNIFEVQLKSGPTFTSKILNISPQGKGEKESIFNVNIELPPANYRLGQTGTLNI